MFQIKVFSFPRNFIYAAHTNDMQSTCLVEQIRCFYLTTRYQATRQSQSGHIFQCEIGPGMSAYIRRKLLQLERGAVFLSCSISQSTVSYQVNTSAGSTYLPGFRGRFTAIHQYSGHCPTDKILTRNKEETREERFISRVNVTLI